jgi:hypothetical protein
MRFVDQFGQREVQLKFHGDDLDDGLAALMRFGEVHELVSAGLLYETGEVANGRPIYDLTPRGDRVWLGDGEINQVSPDDDGTPAAVAAMSD